MTRKAQILFILASLGLFLGMIGRGVGLGEGELRSEVRLRIYNEAIRHYEKAEAFYQVGQHDKALKALRKATRVVKAFPEAYELAQKIYLEMGKEGEAHEQEGLFKQYQGHQGASLYRLRDRVAEEIEFRKRLAPPPDIQPFYAYLVSGLFAAILILGMVYETRRATQGRGENAGSSGIVLERFPGEDEGEAATTWLFRICAFLLPAPFLFSLLVFLGVRHFSNMVPPFLFSWVIVALAIQLIFFADLSGLSGLRRPPGSGME